MSDSEIELLECPPTVEVLPEKSKYRYEQTYQAYRDWCLSKDIDNFDSEDVVLSYFIEMGAGKKASTLWAKYSMLRTVLSHRDKVDMSKFTKLGAYLKKQSVGYKPKKSSILTIKNIDTFLTEAPADFLPQKVALIIGVSGACRTEELFNMKTTDVDFLENKVVVLIQKVHHPRSFVITNPEWISILTQYMNLRKNIKNERFFMQIRFGNVTKQPFGKNTMAEFPRKIATWLKLKNLNNFTGHCFRRTAAALFANTMGAWKPYKDMSLGRFEVSANNSVKRETIEFNETDTASQSEFTNKPKSTLLSNQDGSTHNGSRCSVSTIESSTETFGRVIGLQLKEMSKIQRCVAEKLISEVIFYGKMDQLGLQSSILLNNMSNDPLLSPSHFSSVNFNNYNSPSHSSQNSS